MLLYQTSEAVVRDCWNLRSVWICPAAVPCPLAVPLCALGLCWCCCGAGWLEWAPSPPQSGDPTGSPAAWGSLWGGMQLQSRRWVGTGCSALPPPPGTAPCHSQPGFHFLLCFSPSPLIGWKSKALLAPPARLSLLEPARRAVPCGAVPRHAGPYRAMQGRTVPWGAVQCHASGAAVPPHPACLSRGVRMGHPEPPGCDPPITEPRELAGSA